MAAKRNLLIFALLCILTVGFAQSGAFFSEREFFNAEPYIPSVAESGAQVPVAGNYSDFKDEVIKVVSRANRNATVRLEEYAGDAVKDVARICTEIKESTPIGAYAVDTITANCTRVLSYYDVKIDISYKRSEEEIRSVEEIATEDELAERVKIAVSQRKPNLAVMCRYFTNQTMDTHRVFDRLRFDESLSLYGVGGYKYTIFPADGMHKIILIDFNYYESIEESQAKQAQTENALNKIIAAYGESTDINQLCGMISENVRIVGDDAPYTRKTPYGVLVEKQADAEGLAVAFKYVSGHLNMYVSVIKGELNGQPHCWNKVFEKGAWRYVDLSRGVILADADELYGYKWDEQ